MSSLPAFALDCADLLKRPILQPAAIEALRSTSRAWLLENISPQGMAEGVVLASPSTTPNYRFHWIRDAGLVMEEAAKFADLALMKKYVDFELRVQVLQPGGENEPKFNTDGTLYTGPWMRPQNDGPAVRACGAIAYARALLAAGQKSYVRQKLYDGVLPATTLIKRDLEFVNYHWRDKSYDVWEEVFALNFFTLATQRRALLDGVQLAREMGDEKAVPLYGEQARLIGEKLNHFWSEEKGYFLASIEQEHGPSKPSGLDSAVLLAALRAGREGEAFSVTDDRILATAAALRDWSAHAFPINKSVSGPDLAPAIGRYPEDCYNGVKVENCTQGNPWFLITAGFAELHYRLHRWFEKTGEIRVTKRNARFFRSLTDLCGQAINEGEVFKKGTSGFDAIQTALLRDGDRFINRVMRHMEPKGHISEQMNRNSGIMEGAEDLSWSYAAVLSALDVRPR